VVEPASSATVPVQPDGSTVAGEPEHAMRHTRKQIGERIVLTDNSYGQSRVHLDYVTVLLIVRAFVTVRLKIEAALQAKSTNRTYQQQRGEIR
jgi:hypothetical protein